MTDEPKNYRIINLQAANFQILKAIDITPTGAVIEIAGENGQGKTSILNAIWAALGGAKASPAVPIRKGEKEAFVHLDLGDLKVTRRWWFKENGDLTSDLRVEAASGARFTKAQEVLSAMVGKFSFDPLAFTKMDAEDQFKAVQAFVPDFDFAAMAGKNQKDFEARTEVNRGAKSYRTQAAAIDVPEKVPAMVDVTALEAKLGEAAKHNAEVATRAGNRQAAAQRVLDAKETGRRLREEAAALIVKAEESEKRAADVQKQLDYLEPLPEPIDVQEVQVALSTARQSNLIAERAARRAELIGLAEAEEARSATLTKAIEDRQKAADAAVAAAKMPVENLTFGDEAVLLNGLPFEQACSADQLKASIAIAAALNPTLRVIRVQDGVLLSKASMKLLEAYAEEHDLQVWVERIEGGPGAVVIQEGEVVTEPEEAF